MVEFVFTLEGGLAFKQPGFMTARPEAGSILYFCVGLGTLRASEYLNRVSRRSKFTTQRVPPTRRKMARLAGHRVMAGVSPTLNIRFHKMAGSTELGGIAVVEEKPTKRSHKPKD